MPYKKGSGYLQLSLNKEGSERKELERLAFAAFIEAEKLNLYLFNLEYQLATMYKNGVGTDKNLIRAIDHAEKAIETAVGSDEKRSAQELKHLIEVDQTINSSKKKEAKDFADRGLEKLKQFQNPPQDSSVEGFDAEALILLGKASLLDTTNYDVEYTLAEMYLRGIGTKPNPIASREHAKHALKIATEQGVDELVKRAKKLTDVANDEYFKIIKLRSKERGSSDEEVSENEITKDKRKSVVFVTTVEGEQRARADSLKDNRKSGFGGIFKNK